MKLWLGFTLFLRMQAGFLTKGDKSKLLGAFDVHHQILVSGGPFSCKIISTEKGTRPMKMVGPPYSLLLSRTS